MVEKDVVDKIKELPVSDTLKDSFIKMYEKSVRSTPYENLYTMAPRTFGQWGEKHINALYPEVKLATKKNLQEEYPEFDGEFDLWYMGKRIEVKACRANQGAGPGTLLDRAYTLDDALEHNFKYHFQQIKPSCCDKFVFVGIHLDTVCYWVVPSSDFAEMKGFSSQHRNNSENDEIYEGQIFKTYEDLKPYLVEENNILEYLK